MNREYKPPRPAQLNDAMMGNPMQDHASIRNPELHVTILSLVRDARSLFSDCASIVDILDQIEKTATQEELSVQWLCAWIARMEQRELPHLADVDAHTQAAVEQFLAHARREMRGALELFRDSTQPLMPHEFVRLNSQDFPHNSPWYVSGFEYLDPHSGTTGNKHVPHLMFVRTPQYIDQPDTVFNGGFFYNSQCLEQQRTDDRPFLMRVHSECFMGETCHHDRCDCQEQLQHAMDEIERNKLGAIIYLRQEARGAGLFDKFRFFGLVDGRNRHGQWIGRGKYDTSTSMTVLGYEDDTRKFGFAVRALRGIGIHPETTPITMITNNPNKTTPFASAGYAVTQRAGAQESVHSAEAVSEMILLKIIKQKHTVPWEQLHDYLEPQLVLIADGRLAEVDIRIRFALLQLGHHLQGGNVSNCPAELRNWVTTLWEKLLKDPENGQAQP